MEGLQKNSPPFEKGRTGGIYEPPLRMSPLPISIKRIPSNESSRRSKRGDVCPSILPAGVKGSWLLLKGCAKSLRNFLKASSRRANNKERLDKS
jgi:hypothetical protein